MDGLWLLFICGLTVKLSFATSSAVVALKTLPREGFTFAQYDLRAGGFLELQCVTTRQLLKFSSLVQGAPDTIQDYRFITNPTVVKNQRYFMIKQVRSQLFNVYSLLIFNASYEKDDRDFFCHTTDGREYETKVKVTSSRKYPKHVIFSNQEYAFTKYAQGELVCHRPDGQEFESFEFQKYSDAPKTHIKNGVEGYKIHDSPLVNYTRLQFVMSDESKVGIYQCNAGRQFSSAKVSMKCKILDINLQNIILKRGKTGVLQIRWRGKLIQQAIQKTWYRMRKRSTVSSWEYAKNLELASSFGEHFFAILNSRYSIRKDGTLYISNVHQEDEGYYKFRLTCGRFGQTTILVKVIVS